MHSEQNDSRAAEKPAPRCGLVHYWRVIEWYDFFLYGVVAGLFFNKLYFPSFDARIGTMLAFATFAVGFVARPLGGVIFGHFGDKLGRKRCSSLPLKSWVSPRCALALSLSYNTIGIELFC